MHRTVNLFVLLAALLCLAPTAEAEALNGAILCSPGTEPNFDGTLCRICSAGTFSPTGEACLSCPPNFVAPTSGSSTCIECPSGYSSNPEHTACILAGEGETLDCPSGSQPNSEETLCEICPPGSFSATGENCLDCPPDSVAPSSGSTTCILCPSGTVPNAEQTDCVSVGVEGEVGASVHSADQDEDKTIGLSELLRVIQFFNFGGFSCAVPVNATEDGYKPGAGTTDCTSHDSDYNPQEWVIGLSELLRLIQFFNSDGYYHCPDNTPPTEDGYCPGSAR